MSEVVALSAVGLNFWALAVAVPAAVAVPRAGWVLLVVTAPLPLLAFAVHRRDAWAALLLFPVSVVGVLAVLPGLTFAAPHPPLARLLAAAGLWLYGAVAARSATRLRFAPAPVHALPATPPDEAALRRARGRRWVLGLGGAGALLLAVVAPGVGGPLARSWGEAAEAAEVFTAVVAAALGTVAVAVFLGRLTRRRRSPLPRRRSDTRVALSLLVVGAGLVVWMLLRRYRA